MLLLLWLLSMGQASAFGPGGGAPTPAGEMLLLACLVGCTLIIPALGTSVSAFLVANHRNRKNSWGAVAAAFVGSLLSLYPSFLLGCRGNEKFLLGTLAIGTMLGALPGLLLFRGEERAEGPAAK